MTTWQVALYTVLLGLVASVGASLVWFVMLRRLHPTIEISPIIAEDLSFDEPTWHIKIINRSKRAAVDLRFEIVRTRQSSARNGAVRMRRSVPCGPAPLVLPGRRRNDTDHSNCYRVRIYENPHELLPADQGRALRMRIYARDEVSGFGSVAERQYTYPPSDIKVGRFACGQTFDIS